MFQKLIFVILIVKKISTTDILIATPDTACCLFWKVRARCRF